MKFDYRTVDSIKGFFVNEKIEQSVHFYEISVEFQEQIIPQEFTIKFTIPLKDIDGIWTPLDSKNTEVLPHWNPHKIESNISQGMPLFCAYSDGGENRFSVALSELKSNVYMGVGVVEETCECEVEIKLFTTPVNPIDEYSFIVRVDYSKIPFYSAIKDVKNWWEKSVGAKPCVAPEASKYPVYSTWYNFHQNITALGLLKELRIAKDLGFDTIIVDDGWQCDDNNRGYAFAGDWKPAPKKIGNAREFVQECHNIGIKAMFWYSVPFIGYETENFERFKGKYLSLDDGQRCAILDPRFKEVRDFLIGLYIEAVKNFDLDGLKLDFIDSFKITPSSPSNYADMDIPVLEEAVFALMCEVYRKLTEIKPQIMLEFRQKYIGPMICAFGNMLRVSDCPYSGRNNARASIDLRLTSGDIPVHTDMTMWHKDTCKEDVARQLMLGLFAVPQISVKLSEIQDEHYKVIKEYLKYWRENMELLLSGEFYCSAPSNTYSFAGVKNTNKEIVMLMTKTNCHIKNDNTDIFNITGENIVYLDFENASGLYKIKVIDCIGKEISSDIFEISGVMKVYSPKTSRIVVERME